MRPTKWFVPFVALLMVVAGCSDSDEAAPDSANSGEAASTTSAADVGADAAYAERGPNEVGTIAFKLDDGRRVQAWYPAADSATDLPLESFDLAGLLNPGLQAQIPADKRPLYEIAAHPDADAGADGPYPVVLFSHGFAGFPGAVRRPGHPPGVVGLSSSLHPTTSSAAWADSWGRRPRGLQSGRIPRCCPPHSMQRWR
jgi:hypothetical protein